MIRIALVSIALAFHSSTHSQLLVETATYFGGVQAEAAAQMVVGNSGNLFIGGNTASANGLATSNAFQEVFGGNYDLLISKWSPEPSLMWSTYYGGPAHDVTRAIAIDDLENIYIAVQAGSANGLASPDAFQVSGIPGPNSLIAKFDASGNRTWATYFSGNTACAILDVRVVDDSSIIIAGSTEATSGLATNEAFLSQNQGGQDLFLARFGADGLLQWCTYLGGSGTDANGRVLISDGFIYLIGTTNSDGVSYNATDGSTTYGENDLLIAKFDLQGTPIKIRYFGGPANEVAQRGIAATSSGIAVSGRTYSTSGIAIGPSSIHQSLPSLNTEQDGDLFIAHFDFDLNLQWATYWGGSEFEELLGLDTDNNGNIYFCGYTSSPEIASPEVPQTTIIGPDDAFFACLRPDGSEAFSTYFGGVSPNEHFADLKVSSGVAHCVGRTASPGLATPGAYQQAPAGAADIIYVRYQLPVGIRENTSNEPSVRMHPNPAAHSTLVQWPPHWEVHTLVLTDLSGRQIAAFPLPRQLWATYLDLQSLAPGIYGVHLLTPQGAHFGGRIVKE
ncbi:MAG: hypothetical protein ACK500_02620 [Flavobacteriales bacterium]